MNQIKKTAQQFLLGALLLSFTAVACNNKGKETKETVTDTTATKMDQAPPPPPAAADTVKKDTADTRPVKPGD